MPWVPQVPTTRVDSVALGMDRGAGAGTAEAGRGMHRGAGR
jgi:hypothetical protein